MVLGGRNGYDRADPFDVNGFNVLRCGDYEETVMSTVPGEMLKFVSPE
jgi:hypothetical protein